MKKYVKTSKQGAPDISSYVYNALGDVAFELSKDGYNVSKADFREAVDNFMTKFFADDSSLDSRIGVVTEDDIESAIDDFCARYREPGDVYYEDKYDLPGVPSEKMIANIFNDLFYDTGISDKELTMATDGLFNSVDKFYDYLVNECGKRGVSVVY